VTKPGKPGLVGGGEQIEFVARIDPNSLERALIKRISPEERQRTLAMALSRQAPRTKWSRARGGLFGRIARLRCSLLHRFLGKQPEQHFPLSRVGFRFEHIREVQNVLALDEVIHRNSMAQIRAPSCHRAAFLDSTSRKSAANGRRGLYRIAHLGPRRPAFHQPGPLKAINDTWGHDGGDFLLKTVAERLRGVLRAEHVAARLGGDEFVVVQGGIASKDEAEVYARRIILALTAPIQFKEQEIIATASVGVSLAPADSKTAAAASASSCRTWMPR
jgi:hypothetical protein